MTGTWIRDTGQAWKVKVLWVFLPLTILTVAPRHSILLMFDVPLRVVDLGGFVLGVATFVWIAAAIRCPHCRQRIGYWYMKNTTPLEWFTAFLGLQRCPVCDFAPVLASKSTVIPPVPDSKTLLP
jgi:hypothetical protein